MFIYPVEKPIDWKKPPLVTAFIILINCFIIFIEPHYDQNSVSWTIIYGFIPDKHRAFTFITYMFLHDGSEHLIGNMVILFLVGFTVEAVIGPMRYLAFYLLSGLCSVMLFWGIYPDSQIPLVGASGCVAGVMGMYSALFGIQKIRFFYIILFYFGYARLPAIRVVPDDKSMNLSYF